MNVSGQISQTLKLPIPRLPNLHTSNAKFPELLIPNNWTPTTSSQFPTMLPSTQPVIPCQPMGKPSPNKRGRKPLSRMPETKKHIQNLTNQRAFRRRREDYVRTLENKSATYELLYSEAQNDIKMLREKLAMLEKRLAKVQENNDKCGVNVSCNTSIYNDNDSTDDITMSNGPYDGNRTLPTITAVTTVPSFSFNIKSISPPISTKSIDSVENIINDPIFCETKEGELCFCEPLEGLNVDDYEKDQTQFSSIGRYEFDQKKGKRMWIINNNSSPYSNTTQTSRKCCSTLPLPEQSEWQLQRQEDYYSPLPSPIPIPTSDSSVSQHHPLNLKWILGDDNGDDNSDDSS